MFEFDGKNPVSDKMKALLVKSADPNYQVAMAAQVELAKALEEPLKKGVLKGDILDAIFTKEYFSPGTQVEYAYDLLTPGTEKDYVAYVMPAHGRTPERHVESDYVTLPTYMIHNSIDYLLRYAEQARWNVVDRAMEILEGGFVRKMNDDGWKTIITAGYDRNIVVFDSDAGVGQFTKRLVSLMKLSMRRNAGGNAASLNYGRLTDLYLSPECVEDIRSWGVDQIDEVTRREIFQAQDGVLNRIFGVNLHDMYELGVAQEYQLFFTNAAAIGGLGGSLASTDTELVVGLDLENRDSFVMPWRKMPQIFPDPFLHRHQREGFYGVAEVGFGALNNQRVLLGSC